MLDEQTIGGAIRVLEVAISQECDRRLAGILGRERRARIEEQAQHFMSLLDKVAGYTNPA